MRVFLSVAVTAAGLMLAAGTSTAASIELVTIPTFAAPLEANGASSAALAVTPDGRHALFTSDASNLLTGDTNRQADLFLHDAQTDTVERVNVGLSGVEADGATLARGALSADGRYAFFGSNARNLVAGVDAGSWQIYLRDRATGTTELVSRDASGLPLGGWPQFVDASADARYVLLTTELALAGNDLNGRYDLYRLDRQTGEYLLVTVNTSGFAAAASTTTGRLSADGRSVAFISGSSDFVSGDTNNYFDVFLRDLDSATTLLASRTTAGQFHPQASYFFPRGRALSDDGRYLTFNTRAALDAVDTNNAIDGYVFDRAVQTIRRLTLDANGAQIPGSESASIGSIASDGSHVAFQSQGVVLPGQSFSNARSYRVPLASNTPQQILLQPPSWGDEVSDCHLDGDGSTAYCRFESSAIYDWYHTIFGNLYRADLAQSTVRRVSRPLDTPMAAADHDSGLWDASDASADGRYVVFSSLASNFVVGDTNARFDLFLRDRVLGTTLRVNRLPGGGQADCGAGESRVSDDGRFVVFENCAALAAGATGARRQVFRYDRVADVMQLVSRDVQGVEANADVILADVSDDGHVVAFYTKATNLLSIAPNPLGDYFVSDLVAGTLTLVSRRAGGQPVGSPGGLRLSGDGRHVLFGHAASDLVDGDTNGVVDLFVFDRETAQIERVSLDAAGNPLTADSVPLGISRDGREILFSTAQALVPGVVGGLYVRDRGAGGIELVSRAASGKPMENPGTYAELSADGTRVAFRCYCPDSGLIDPEASFVDQLYLYDRRSANLSLVTPADISQYVASHRFAGDDHLVFATRAGNLVTNDANNHFSDVFIASGVGDVLFADGLEAP
ncbi:MAG: hypothetical protein AMXMBFR59_11340 [Rhodanobacteraceae bacterium]